MTKVVIHQKRAPADFKSARQKRYERRCAKREERAAHPMLRVVYRAKSPEEFAALATMEIRSPSPTEAELEAARLEFLEPENQKRLAVDFLEKLRQPSLLTFRRTPPK